MLIGVVGDHSTGKSTSFKYLDNKKTFIIDVKKEPLPWRGSENDYNEGLRNYIRTSNWLDILQIIENIAEKRPEIENIIVDDAGFIMSNEFFKRASESGFTKFSEIGQHMFKIVDACKALPNRLNVIFTFHRDVDKDALGEPIVRIKTIGRMIEEKYTLEAQFTVLLFSCVNYDKNGKADYKFVTNRTLNYPAKSPDGMFEDLYIDNNLQNVVTTMRKYYSSSE